MKRIEILFLLLFLKIICVSNESDNPQNNQTFFWNRPQATPSPPIFVPPQPSTVQPSWTDPTVDTNGIETFYEIGSPLQPREKREIVVFPEDELLPANATIDDVSIEFQSAADERTARQILQTITKIDVGPQSQLFVAPGSTSVIYFEVTNLRNEPTYHNFNVQDEKRYLRQMEPRFLWLMPNQRESVRVTILVPQGSELGSKDKITFTSQSVVQVQQSVMVTVSSTGVVDSWQPRIWYTYNTRCDWRWNCVGGTWSIEVVARDYETGLLSMRSTPEGLVLRSPFVAGTNEEVTATYSASCCEPRVTITAYDLNRNQRTLQLNVDDPWLSEYGIATVVLACLFLILLIILIVIWVIWCIKRRRKQEHNLEGPIH